MGGEQGTNVEEGEIEESPSSTAKIDVIDMPSKKAIVSNYDIFVLVMSIVTHIIDLIFDINVAWHYLSTEQYNYFACTVFVILVPSFINNTVSYRMRQQDREKALEDAPVEKLNWKQRTLGILGNIFSIIFQVAPLKSYCVSLRYAIKSRLCQKQEDTAGQKKYYLKMVKENEDIALITIFECFMETAPQQVVQTSIVLLNFNGQITATLVHQLLSIGSSFISMGWSMASYHRSIRLAQEDKLNIGLTGSILQFLWHLLITISRIVTFATALMLSTVGSLLFILIHWIAMTTWIVTDSKGTKEFCRNRRKPPHAALSVKERFNTLCFSFLLGIIYTFVYVNTDDNSTYMRHFIYYSSCILENIIVCVFWILTPSARIICFCYNETCYVCTLPVLCLLPYVIGVAIMIIYYLYFHPSKRQKIPTEP